MSIKSDIITELTTNSGVTIEGVLLKDTGITLTNRITKFSTDDLLSGNSDFYLPTEKAVKTYVDNNIEGLQWKESCKGATTANISLAGGLAPAGLDTGVALVENDRVLVWNQTDKTQNGIYLAHALSAWTRSLDADTAAKLIHCVAGVREGDTYADLDFFCTNNSITEWTTDIIFVQKSSSINHGLLLGLQGGQANQYYHLTSAEHVELTNWMDNVTLDTNGSVDLGTGILTTPKVQYTDSIIIDAKKAAATTITLTNSDGGFDTNVIMDEATVDTINGSLVASGTLTLNSTTDITKGFIILSDTTKVDNLVEKTLNSGVTIEGVLIKDSGITLVNNVTEFSIDNTLSGNSDLAVPTEKATKEYIDNINVYMLGAGVVSGFAITNNGDGTVNVAGGVCYLRSSNADAAPIAKYTVGPSAIIALTNMSNNYVYIDYNGGVPIYAVTVTGATVRDNENTFIELYEIFRDGTRLYITPHMQRMNNNTRNSQRYIYDLHGHSRTSGLMLGETGTRNITMTTGRVWLKYNYWDVNPKNTSTGDTYETAYYNGSAWVITTGVTQWNNTQYNNIASGLATMTTNRWSFQSFWLMGDNTLLAVYAQAEYTSQAAAQSAPMLTFLPARIGSHTTYLGRVVFQKSAATATFLSPFVILPTIGAITSHNSLSNLGSDDHTQYAFLAGRSGGQTLIGGTVASNNLVLQSTSDATRGYINLVDNTKIDGKVAIGTTINANRLLNISKTVAGTYGTWIEDSASYDAGDNNQYNFYISSSPTLTSAADYFMMYCRTNLSNVINSYSLDIINSSLGSTSYGAKIMATGATGANYGIYAAATGATTNYGIWSGASGGTTNYAGYFYGDLLTTGTLLTNTIAEQTAASGISFNHVIKADSISEKTAAAGITLNNTLKVDAISEKTGSSGITLNNTLKVDTIAEKTSAAGVTIDGILLKDTTVSIGAAFDATKFLNIAKTGAATYGSWIGDAASYDAASATQYNFYVSSTPTLTNGTSYNTMYCNTQIASITNTYGLNIANSSTSTTNYGINVSTTGAGTTNYGIYSTASGSGTNYAGYFSGNILTTGTLYVDTIAEKTAANGINIDGLLLKDYGFSTPSPPNALIDAFITTAYTDTTKWLARLGVKNSNCAVFLGVFDQGGTDVPTVAAHSGALDAWASLNLGSATGTTTTTVRSLDILNYIVGGGSRTVSIDNSGYMGYISSVRETKTNIKYLANEDTSWIYKLDPVMFNFKERDPKTRKLLDKAYPELNYGLIAEDVELVNKDLCIYDKKGKLSAVRYDQISPLALHLCRQQKKEIDQLKTKISDLETKIKLISDKLLI